MVCILTYDIQCLSVVLESSISSLWGKLYGQRSVIPRLLLLLDRAGRSTSSANFSRVIAVVLRVIKCAVNASYLMLNIGGISAGEYSPHSTFNVLPDRK